MYHSIRLDPQHLMMFCRHTFFRNLYFQQGGPHPGQHDPFPSPAKLSRSLRRIQGMCCLFPSSPPALSNAHYLRFRIHWFLLSFCVCRQMAKLLRSRALSLHVMNWSRILVFCHANLPRSMNCARWSVQLSNSLVRRVSSNRSKSTGGHYMTSATKCMIDGSFHATGLQKIE